MILDTYTQFADNQSVAQAAGTYNLGDVIDTGAVVRDIGMGQPLYLVITVDTEIITGGSAGTIQFQLVSDAVTTPDTSTASKHLISPAYVTDGTDANDAELKQGQTVWQVALPPEGQQYERYLGVQYIVATTTTTAGNVSAYLTFDPHGNKHYPDAVN